VNGDLFCEGSIELDPNCECREVRQRTVQTDGSLWQMECAYERCGGVMLPKGKKTLSRYQGKEVTSQAQFRLLSPQEGRRLRVEVEQAIDSMPDEQSWQRYAPFLAIGTPLLGILLLSVKPVRWPMTVNGPQDSGNP
jgi:hypothetical protein